MPLPVKGTRASFDPDQAWWNSLCHLQQLIAHHASSQDNLTIGVYAMKLEHILGDIDSQNRNVCHDTSLVGATSVTAGWGNSPSH